MTWLPAHLRVGAHEPLATALLLHGILGSGRNLRTFATRLCAQVPGLQCVLVDLRNHGDSTGAPPPHTVHACAEDLLALARHLGVQPAAVLGHSYGGKVALQYAAMRPPGLRQVWVLDATPGAEHRDGGALDPGEPERVGVADVVAVLAEVPQPLPDREAVLAELTQRQVPPAIAQWLTTSVRPVPGGLVWKFDLPAVREMLADYLDTDLWPVLEQPPPGMRIDVVRATREPRWTPAILKRFQGLPPAVQLHGLDAGHWLHVDDLEGLVRLIVPSLQSLVTH